MDLPSRVKLPLAIIVLVVLSVIVYVIDETPHRNYDDIDLLKQAVTPTLEAPLSPIGGSPYQDDESPTNPTNPPPLPPPPPPLEALSYLAAPYLFVMLLLGMAVKAVLRASQVQVPFTVAVMLLGVILGIAYETLTECDAAKCTTESHLVNSMRMWVNIDPHLLLNIFLPALIFSDSFTLSLHMVRRCATQCLLLACPGVLLGTLLMAWFAHEVLPHQWSWVLCFMFGSILSATDPVAVLSLLKDLGASKNLSMLVAGEALFNDGTALVLFEIYSNVLAGEVEYTTSVFVRKFLWMGLGGPVVGFLFGLGGYMCLAYTRDGIIETVITLCVAYLGFFVAENVAEVSGVLAVVASGITLSALGNSSIRGKDALHHVWATVEFCGYSLIFILAGNIFGSVVAEPDNGVGLAEFGRLVMLWLALMGVRSLMVALFFPLLQLLGYGLDWKDAGVLVWGGLRGAVGLAMAVIADEADFTSTHEGKLVVFYCGGVAVLTVLVNGWTCRWLMEALGMLQPSVAEDTLTCYVRKVIQRRVVGHYSGLSEDPCLTFHDPAALHGLCPVLSDTLLLPTRLQGFTSSHSLGSIRQKMREIFLCVVRSTYWDHITVGALPEGLPAVILLQSVEAALDRSGECGFHDWDDMRTTLADPFSLLRLAFNLSTRIKKILRLPPSRSVEENMSTAELDCHLTLNYIQAHQGAGVTCMELISDTNAGASHQAMMSEIVGESTVCIKVAQAHLSQLLEGDPHLLPKLLSKQTAMKVFAQQRLHVENMLAAGLLAHHVAQDMLRDIEAQEHRTLNEDFQVRPLHTIHWDDLQTSRQDHQATQGGETDCADQTMPAGLSRRSGSSQNDFASSSPQSIVKALEGQLPF